MKTIATGLLAFAAKLPALLRDGAGLAGVGLIAYGAYLFSPSAGFITGGALLLIGVLLTSLASVQRS